MHQLSPHQQELLAQAQHTSQIVLSSMSIEPRWDNYQSVVSDTLARTIDYLVTHHSNQPSNLNFDALSIYAVVAYRLADYAFRTGLETDQLTCESIFFHHRAYTYLVTEIDESPACDNFVSSHWRALVHCSIACGNYQLPTEMQELVLPFVEHEDLNLGMDVPVQPMVFHSGTWLEPLPQPVDKEVKQQLHEVMQSDSSDDKDKAIALIVSLALAEGAGLRLSEISGLKKKDIKVTSPLSATVTTRTGRVARIEPLWAETVTEYIKHLEDDQWVIVPGRNPGTVWEVSWLWVELGLPFEQVYFLALSGYRARWSYKKAQALQGFPHHIIAEALDVQSLGSMSRMTEMGKYDDI